MPARSSTKQLPLLPEAELLVWCARTVVSDELKRSIRRRVQESLDWSIVLGMARYHGMCPLLYRNLAALCSDLVPAKPLTQLRQKVQADALLNRSLAQELVLLCDALASNGLSVIPIKGATLAVLAYGDLALREFTDLDLLIPEGSIAEAQRVILLLGYERKANSVEGHQLEDKEGPYHVLIKKRPISRVDLQWVMAHQH
ncbi:MAG: nucleotidyltransferase family protein [Nitrospirota bacterium]